MNAKEILMNKGIRPSIIRVEILNFLMNTKSHPTVEDIYNLLCDKIPTLSKTSVYNTLKLLHENHIITEVTIDSSKVRYDYDISLHGHFICERCKKVFDFDANLVKNDILNGAVIKSKEVYFRGICKECLNNKLN